MKRFTKHVPCARDSCTSCASKNTDYLTGAVVISSLVNSLVSSLVSSLDSSSSNSLLGSSSLGYRYSFTIMVLKLVGLLGSYTLYISLLIPSNLNRPVHLLLCLVLPLRYISTSKLRGRL